MLTSERTSNCYLLNSESRLTRCDLQCLLKVGDDVIDMFDTDTEADHICADPCGNQFIIR